MKLNIFSDLRNPGLVLGESLSLAQNYVFCFRETLIYIMSNGMRNLHIQSLLCLTAGMMNFLVLFTLLSELTQALIVCENVAFHMINEIALMLCNPKVV